jgi:hypothetical protein
MKPTIILLNNTANRCGIYQYGLRTINILMKSKLYNFIHIEVENETQLADAINNYNPIAIIYNHHHFTMPWLNTAILNKFPNIKHYGMFHGEPETSAIRFDYLLCDHPYHIDTPQSFAIQRPLIENNFVFEKPTITTISSYGLGSPYKGFQKIVKIVNDQFDEAIIRLHISEGFYAEKFGCTMVQYLSDLCQKEMRKPNIQLQITSNFINDIDMLKFLASSSINMFLYDVVTAHKPIMASAVDYALSVKVPLAINNSNMFNHIISPPGFQSIRVEDRSITDIITSGTETVDFYANKWSTTNFLKRHEDILVKTL